MSKTNKHLEVLNYMRNHVGITSMVAYDEFGATRLAAIIFDLKKKGYDIYDLWVESIDRYGNTCRYKEYRLVNDITEEI